MTPTSPPTLAQIRERDRQELADYNSNALLQQMPPIERWSVPASIDRRELLRLLDESHAQIDGLMKRLLREEQDARRLGFLIEKLQSLRINGEVTYYSLAHSLAFLRGCTNENMMRAAIDSAMASQGGGDG